MNAWILELRAGSTLRRHPKVFWTRDGAQREADYLLARGKCQEVEILPATVDPTGETIVRRRAGEAQQ